MISWLLTRWIRGYQLFLSPLLPQSCRYYPSCSVYGFTAIERFGAVRGVWLTMRRLGRCHPWTPGGVDLVPQVVHYTWWGRSVDSDPTSPVGAERGHAPQSKE